MTHTEWLCKELRTAIASFKDVPMVAPKNKAERIAYQNGLRSMALFMLQKIEANENWADFRKFLGDSASKELPEFQSELKLVKKRSEGKRPG